MAVQNFANDPCVSGAAIPPRSCGSEGGRSPAELYSPTWEEPLSRSGKVILRRKVAR